MAKSSNLLVVVALVIVVVIVLMMRPSPVIVQDSPVKFSSVRKHPFDVYSDPYHPPERQNPYLSGSYEQVGVLKGNSAMLPLFGRPSPYSSNRWEYYTMSDGLKLPVAYKNKPCDSDTGCEELVGNNKDTLDVLGMGPFKSFVYASRQPRYSPML